MLKKKVANILIIRANEGFYISRADDPEFKAKEVWLGKGDLLSNYIEVKEEAIEDE